MSDEKGKSKEIHFRVSKDVYDIFNFIRSETDYSCEEMLIQTLGIFAESLDDSSGKKLAILKKQEMDNLFKKEIAKLELKLKGDFNGQ